MNIRPAERARSVFTIIRISAIPVAAIFAALTLLAMGCQQSNNRKTTRAAGQPFPGESIGRVAPSGDSTKAVSADDAIASDPCAKRLHDIAGSMLMYYAINRQMPAQLAELLSVQDDGGVQLDFSCPASHKPYGYSAQGLTSPGRKKLVMVYDSAPHDGVRWCVLAASARPGEAVSLEVLPLSEPVFLSYRPAGQP